MATLTKMLSSKRFFIIMGMLTKATLSSQPLHLIGSLLKGKKKFSYILQEYFTGTHMLNFRFSMKVKTKPQFMHCCTHFARKKTAYWLTCTPCCIGKEWIFRHHGQNFTGNEGQTYCLILLGHWSWRNTKKIHSIGSKSSVIYSLFTPMFSFILWVSVTVGLN